LEVTKTSSANAPAPFEREEALDHPEPGGPDLTLGLAQDKLADGAALLGHVGGEEVLLARIGNEFFAVGARCTHYRGPLFEDSWSAIRFDVRGIMLVLT
jgi:hypothetical protein